MTESNSLSKKDFVLRNKNEDFTPKRLGFAEKRSRLFRKKKLGFSKKVLIFFLNLDECRYLVNLLNYSGITLWAVIVIPSVVMISSVWVSFLIVEIDSWPSCFT